MPRCAWTKQPVKTDSNELTTGHIWAPQLTWWCLRGNVFKKWEMLCGSQVWEKKCERSNSLRIKVTEERWGGCVSSARAEILMESVKDPMPKCLYLDPWAWSSPCPVKENEWAAGWEFCCWQRLTRHNSSCLSFDTLINKGNTCHPLFVLYTLLWSFNSYRHILVFPFMVFTFILKLRFFSKINSKLYVHTNLYSVR